MSDHPSNFEPLRFKNINLKILMPWIPRYGFLIDELISYFYPRTLLVEVNSDAPKYNYFTQVSHNVIFTSILFRCSIIIVHFSNVMFM